MRNFVVCACAGTLMAGMPGELLAKPASSDYQQIIECPVDFASGKGSIKVFQNMENDAEAVYYLPTRFELAREKDKDSGLVLPLLSLRITQRKSPKSGELEEFADLKGTFDISLSEMVREKIKKLVKDNSGLDIAKAKILPLPVKKVTAILYTSSGKKICEMPTSVIGNFKGTQFVVAGRLDNQQSL
ncbi:MAG: hypothetical protein PHD82_04685 [Candidatus Riflebacteria bacterium]|nr:hypothetical protein [Candidatus Riflebacteria bacterium]